MHESRFVDDLIRQIEKVAAQSGAKSVRGVKVQLGPLAEMTAEHFRRHFEYAARGTLVEEASLEMSVPDRVDHPLGQHVLLESVTLEE